MHFALKYATRGALKICNGEIFKVKLLYDDRESQ